MRLEIERLTKLRGSLSGLISDVRGYDKKRNNPKTKSADLHWDAAAIERIAHEVHCQCVEAGLADPYPDECYGDTFQRDGWHDLKFNRRRPEA